LNPGRAAQGLEAEDGYATLSLRETLRFVTQICNLLYRRFVTCQAPLQPRRVPLQLAVENGYATLYRGRPRLRVPAPSRCADSSLACRYGAVSAPSPNVEMRPAPFPRFPGWPCGLNRLQ
jgi:hypothetical protein